MMPPAMPGGAFPYGTNPDPAMSGVPPHSAQFMPPMPYGTNPDLAMIGVPPHLTQSMPPMPYGTNPDLAMVGLPPHLAQSLPPMPSTEPMMVNDGVMPQSSFYSRPGVAPPSGPQQSIGFPPMPPIEKGTWDTMQGKGKGGLGVMEIQSKGKGKGELDMMLLPGPTQELVKGKAMGKGEWDMIVGPGSKGLGKGMGEGDLMMLPESMTIPFGLKGPPLPFPPKGIGKGEFKGAPPPPFPSKGTVKGEFLGPPPSSPLLGKGTAKGEFPGPAFQGTIPMQSIPQPLPQPPVTLPIPQPLPQPPVTLPMPQVEPPALPVQQLKERAPENKKDKVVEKPVSLFQLQHFAAYMFTLLCFVIFSAPTIICLQLAQDHDVAYWIGKWGNLAWLVPLFLVGQHLYHTWMITKTERRRRYLFIIVPVVPCILFMFIGGTYMSFSSFLYGQLKSESCSNSDFLAAKYRLQRAYDEARTAWDQCVTRQRAQNGGMPLRRIPLLQACEEWEDMTREDKTPLPWKGHDIPAGDIRPHNPDNNLRWQYLANAELNHVCGGFCESGPSLWVSYRDTGHQGGPCSKYIAFRFLSVQHSATIVFATALTIFVLAFPVYFSARSHLAKMGYLSHHAIF